MPVFPSGGPNITCAFNSELPLTTVHFNNQAIMKFMVCVFAILAVAAAGETKKDKRGIYGGSLGYGYGSSLGYGSYGGYGLGGLDHGLSLSAPLSLGHSLPSYSLGYSAPILSKSIVSTPIVTKTVLPAPIIKTYATPVIKTYSAPIIKSYAAPVIKTYAAPISVGHGYGYGLGDLALGGHGYGLGYSSGHGYGLGYSSGLELGHGW